LAEERLEEGESGSELGGLSGSVSLKRLDLVKAR
jgi:hypothetical protein